MCLSNMNKNAVEQEEGDVVTKTFPFLFLTLQTGDKLYFIYSSSLTNFKDNNNNFQTTRNKILVAVYDVLSM